MSPFCNSQAKGFHLNYSFELDMDVPSRLLSTLQSISLILDLYIFACWEESS